MSATPTFQSAPSDRRIGDVKWYSPAKGYGFISLHAADVPGSSEIFVHHSSVTSEGDLESGDRVRFELEQGPKGPAAKNVERL